MLEYGSQWWYIGTKRLFASIPSSHIFYPKASKGSHENATAGRTRCEATAKEMEEKERRNDNMAIIMKKKEEGVGLVEHTL